MNWAEFIKEIAIDKFSSATIRLTFITVFTNYDKSLTECRIILDKDIKTIGGHLTEIYEYFESEYPKLKEFTKKRPELIRYLRSLYASHEDITGISDRTQIPTIQIASDRSTPPPPIQIAAEPIQELNPLEFIGRDRDLTNLANLSRQAKIVLIKAGAGVGKSTLAREFLQTHFKKVIRIEMGLESGNVTPAEEQVSQILRKDFDEEPSRDFGINLDILREKLADRANPIGILIDNLEPALDENYRFREKLRGYDALLAVLGDRDVCSFTLITSRRSLITPRAKVHEYLLEGLDITAWRQYFHDCENGANSEALLQMRDAYNGNAKVMDILHGAIKNRFDGNIGAYWSRYKDALLADSELETLISVEMDWLRDHQPDAYKLLCRMGCYRYQDVKTVPFEGLICLLWDVPESRQSWVVDYLSKTSLIEVKGEYYLHPAVRKKARSKLKDNTNDWEKANLCGARFFMESVLSVETTEDALIAFEAFYFYIEIKDYILAAEVLLKDRDNIWEKQSEHGTGELLGYSFLRLGLFETIIPSIQMVLNKLDNLFILANLHNIYGDLLWLTGKLNEAIESHEKTHSIVKHFDSSIYDSSVNDSRINLLRKRLLSSLMNRGLCYLSLGNHEQAHYLFLELQSQSNHLMSLISGFNFNSYLFDAKFCLALTYSLKYNEQMVFYCISEFKQLEFDTYYDSWSRGYSSLFIAKAYNNINDNYKAVTYYEKALNYSSASGFKQVQAIANSGIGEIYRKTKNYQSSLDFLNKSVAELKYLGANADLAEAYFQLGLTYQAMGEHDHAEEYKAKALELFEQMEAPKQIERVNKALEQGAKK